MTAKSQRILPAEGVFDRPEGRVTLEDGRVVLPAKDTTKKEAEPEVYSSLVLFGNTGDWLHGASARIAFEDGTILERELPAAAKWVRYEIRYKSRLAWAVVDPERRNVWDWNRVNDSKVLRSGEGAAKVLSKRAPAKYTGFAAWLSGLLSQLAWTLA